MHRRAFSRTLLGATAASSLAATGLWPVLAQAQAAGFKEGSDYRRLTKPAPVDAPAGKIEVIEFFSYSCIHCFNFEPLLKDWMKTLPANVVVRRTPVGFNKAFEPLQRWYYALEALDKLDALHDKAFAAIHEDKQRLNSAESIADWAAKQGLDRAQFLQTFNSFGVVGKVRRATQLQDAYEVEGTPALGIAGRFYIPGQAARTLTIANALIKEAAKA